MKQPELTLLDPYLKPFAQKLEGRRRRAILRTLDFTDGKRPLKDCFNNHLYYGLHKTANGWVFREKAPNAVQVYIYDAKRVHLFADDSVQTLIECITVIKTCQPVCSTYQS